MKKIFLLTGLCFSFSLLAQQPPTKNSTAAALKGAVKPGIKLEEQKKAEETSITQDLKQLYKSTEPARTKLKNHAVSHYNTITSSDSFQLGKCVLGGIVFYYGIKQLQCFTTHQTNAAMGGIILGDNHFAEVNPKAIYHFLESRRNFNAWFKDPVTKAGIKILAGSFLLKKPAFELVSVYNKAVKRYL